MKLSNNKQSGFTLLELLVVVGILAIIGGALVSTFGGQEENAAQGTATNTIAGIENGLRVFEAVNDGIPDNLESLICLPTANEDDAGAVANVSNTPIAAGASAAAATAYPLGGQSNIAKVGGGMGAKLAGKFQIAKLDSSALISAGVTKLRYAAVTACTDSSTAFDIGAALTQVTYGATITGALQDVSIPNHIFASPRAGTGRNRGRGFSGLINSTNAATTPLMVWEADESGYNNVKVGGAPTDVLVGLGIGNESNLVGNESTALYAKAPFYGQIGKDKYAHYIALVKVGTATLDTDGDSATNPSGHVLSTFSAASIAEVIAVIDARGDFLDEEIAEFTDQKK